MPNALKVLSLAGVCALVLALTSSSARADSVISSGPFSVGVATTNPNGPGDLYTFGSGIGFRRNSDNFDPLAPGSPRDSWGVSANGVGGYADQAFFGSSNISLNTSSSTANSAFVSTFFNNGSGNILQIDQTYTFAAANVVKIATTITNLTGSPQAVLFQRSVDWDVAPTMFNEVTHIPANPKAPVSDDTFYGFDNPDPTVPFGSSGYPAGGTQQGDLGGGIKVDLGTLGAGASTSFNFFYGISDNGQNETGLINELNGLGATFIVSTDSSEKGQGIGAGENAAAIGFALVPEPASLTLLGLGLLGAVGYRCWRRKARA